jgi:hypothetical protein
VGVWLMALGQYVKQLMGDASIYTTAQAAGVSNGGLHAIVRGQVEKPTPDVLERLALHFGKADQERREIYAELMRLAGYLELMPQQAQPLTPDEMQEQALRDTEARARAMGITEEDELGTSRKRNSYP